MPAAPLLVLLLLLLLGVAAAGTGVATRSGLAASVSFQQLVTLGNNASTGDYFGSAVAIDGDMVVVGAPRRRGGWGSAHVFECNYKQKCNLMTEVQPQATETSTAAPDDGFGTAVSANSGVLAVGAPFAHGGDGLVYLYQCVAISQCTLVRALRPTVSVPLKGATKQFGTALAQFGSRLVVGAPTQNNQGAVYVFTCETGPSSCVQTTMLVASDAEVKDLFGFSVAMQGSTIVVGAPDKQDICGAVYVFDCANWPQCVQASRLNGKEGIVTATDAPRGFGFSVGISGSIVVGGAPYSNNESGAVNLYECATPYSCKHTSAMNGGSEDLAGYSVAISQCIVVVGTKSEVHGSFIFDCSSTSRCRLSVQMPMSGVFHSVSVGMSDSMVVVGASLANAEQGGMYLFSCAQTAAGCSMSKFCPGYIQPGPGDAKEAPAAPAAPAADQQAKATCLMRNDIAVLVDVPQEIRCAIRSEPKFAVQVGLRSQIQIPRSRLMRGE